MPPIHRFDEKRKPGSFIDSNSPPVVRPQDGIWIIDADGNTMFANARMAEILGATVDEMIGQPSFSYVYPEDTAAAQRLFDAKSKGDSKPFQFRLRRKDGSETWVAVQGTPLRNAKGEFNGIVRSFTVNENV